MKKDFKNILVMQTAFIGDAILASSVLEKLHDSFPEAKISLLVKKGNESLYEAHPFLNKILVWNKNEGKYASLFNNLKQVRAAKFDAVINLHRFMSSGFITAFSGAKYKSGYSETPFSFLFTKKVKHVIGDGRHETFRYNELIEDITNKTVSKPKLYPTKQDFDFVQKYKTGKYITMSPASVWRTKKLPEAKWVELCNNLPEDLTIYFLGSKNDMGLCNSLKSKAKIKNGKVVAGELTLLQSAALMKDAQMNYVNDSAPLHLTSAVNAPVTAFFCSTVPAFGFGPLSDNSKIIEVKNLECRPCGLHGVKDCPLGHFKCGFNMDVKNI
ncbi:MAG TPA: glycosyltransferase family 9 protein [Bacteroidia bacterium]|nr:glycosyltransferase family 9 protein [Bacteroidia bacterium]